MTQQRNRSFLVIGALALVAGCAGAGFLAPNLPRGYDRLFSPHEHAFRFAETPEPVRRGTRSERFELRDGDCGGSDCENPRYRSEIQSTEPRGRVNEDIWYGWSFRNQSIPTFAPDTALRVVLGQFKLAGETPPAFRLVQMGQGEGNWLRCDPAVCRRTNDTREDVVIQLADMAAARNWGDAQNGGHICKLFSMEDAATQWMDIVVNTNYGTGENGYLRVWVNGVQKCDYRGPLIATFDGALKDRPNVRRGIFGSYTERWTQSRGDAPKPTLVAYYDEFSVGSRREDVDVRLREAAGARPVD